MKSIYERLKPDILASINADEQQFPYTTKALKEKLKNSVIWEELSISDVRSIVIHSHVKITSIDVGDFMWGENFLINDNNR
tara:strand:- start:363 stop:605 length:243 start_codon:yes stop_codon:yes gene_type:complete